MKGIVIVGAGDLMWNMVDIFELKYRLLYIHDEPRQPGETKTFSDPRSGSVTVPVELREDIHYLRQIRRENDFISCIGEPRHKRARLQPIKDDLWFTTLIHDSVFRCKSSKVGEGVMIQPNCMIYADAEIGDHVTMCGASNVGHHSKVGDYSTFGHHVFLGGRVTIEEGVFMGSGSKVKPGVTIGEGAVIGMGAVVLKDILPNEIWVGNPARPLRDKSRQPGPRKRSPKKLMEAW